MDDLPTPLSRIELYLAKACGMDVTVPEQPESRLEDFLAVIAGDTSIMLPTPASLTELWLNFVAGGALTDEMKLEGAYWIGPQKVDVRFFAIAGGMDGVVAPQPQNRTEQYWARIAEIRPIHGVLKYATGTSITLTDVVRGITSLENVYGDTAQQTYTGKNLWNRANPFTQTGVGSYTFSLPAGAYTFSVSDITSDGTDSNFRLALYYNDSAYVGGNIDNTTKKLTLTATQPVVSIAIYSQSTYAGSQGVTTTFNNFMIESGSTATSFEPYVGGIPSPNPDYPQDMQIVTGEQTVDIHGKNIFNGGTWRQIRTDGGIPASVPSTETIIIDSGTNFVKFSVPTTYRGAESDYIPVTAGQTITLSFNAVKICNRMWISQYDSSKTRVGTLNNTSIVATTTFTTTDDGFIRVAFANTTGGENFEIDNIQLELGQTATTYEPYQSQDYTVNLGSLELAKIGTYQDYIYKSGDDWYVHKAINKRILNGTEYWEPNTANTFFTNAITDYATSGNVPYSKYFSGYTNVPGMTSVRDNTICFINQSGQTTPRFYIRYVGTFTETSGLRTWLSTNTPSIYYALATATDTKITDSTLISQLNAVNSAILPKPVAYITVGSTSPNLPASIKISYYGEEE